MERTIREYEDVSSVPEDELRDILMRAAAHRAEYVDLDDPHMVKFSTDVLDRLLDEVAVRAAARELEQFGIGLFLPVDAP
jgi:hypothetical protein